MLGKEHQVHKVSCTHLECGLRIWKNRKMADICGSGENPNLTYLVVVPGAVHFGKTYKCS